MRYLILLALIACSDTPSAKSFAFSDLTFDLPAHWKQSVQPGKTMSSWAPIENKRGESIVLVRSNLPNGTTPSDVRQLLEQAQGTLTTDRVEAKDLRTANGLVGSRIDVSYVPPGMRVPYRRVHIVLVDGSELVHVIYTARDGDPDLTAVSTLLQSLHQA
jgi:hypothetical protein